VRGGAGTPREERIQEADIEGRKIRHHMVWVHLMSGDSRGRTQKVTDRSGEQGRGEAARWWESRRNEGAEDNGGFAYQDITNTLGTWGRRGDGRRERSEQIREAM